MAPKPKGKAEAGGTIDEETLAECQRLQSLAYEGVLSRSRRMCTDEAAPSKVLTKADGKDIVKKSSVRKGRYLLNINAQIAAVAAGRMGSLAHLDSRNPVMYIDFPEGRMKFFGTLMFPANKYMVLKFGAKDIVCEDILESMVVFSEAWWVGRKEENPSEAKLPLPQSLIEAGMKAGEAEANGGTQPAVNGSAQPVAKVHRETRKHSAGEAEESSSGSSEEDAGDADRSPAVGRRMSQRSAGKRPRYNVDASDEDDGAGGSEDEYSSDAAGGSDDNDSDAEQRQQRPRKKLARSSQGARRGSQAGMSQQVTEEEAGDDGGEDEGCKSPAATPARKRGVKNAAGQGSAEAAPGKRAAAATPKRPAAKRAMSLDSGDEDDNVIDLSSPRPSQSQRPQRAAAKKPAGAARVDAGSDEDKDVEAEASEDEQDDEDFSL